MLSRPATDSDAAALTALQARWDTRWFGAPEQDEAELRIMFDVALPREQRTRVLQDEAGAVVGAAWWSTPTQAAVLVDPDVEQDVPSDDLVSWCRAAGVAELGAFAADTTRRDALQRNGWRHGLSSFELLRAVGGPDGWQPDAPSFPPSYRLGELTGDDHPQAYDLVYERVRWADIPGHHRREADEWSRLFCRDVPPDLAAGRPARRHPGCSAGRGGAGSGVVRRHRLGVAGRRRPGSPRSGPGPGAAAGVVRPAGPVWCRAGRAGRLGSERGRLAAVRVGGAGR